MKLKVALIQTCTPADAASALRGLIPLTDRAAKGGADLIVMPECANLMETRTTEKARKVTDEHTDILIQGVREQAITHNRHILIGSAIVHTDEDDGRYANRSLLIAPDGEILARYDKVHLFDAVTPDGRVYSESVSIRPGERAVVAPTPWGGLGLTICYDVRFAHLYRELARNGADIIAVPAAFTVPTGKAHWEVLLRARAIETGAFVLAPAQGGTHEDGRSTWGHSLVVNPWGEIVAQLDHDGEDVLFADLDLSEVVRARQALPQLQHDRKVRMT